MARLHKLLGTELGESSNRTNGSTNGSNNNDSADRNGVTARG
jgi:hypothetical protein